MYIIKTPNMFIVRKGIGDNDFKLRSNNVYYCEKYLQAAVVRYT